jgi:DNA mismatch repair protein MutL
MRLLTSDQRYARSHRTRGIIAQFLLVRNALRWKALLHHDIISGNMAIARLSPELVRKIAAGEVIERPASVVKELVENSLDAGASRVEVEVRGGGIQLVRVSDDGVGIEPEEVELAFQRYATSKLKGEEDLARIASLGFRGEALPSIAAVAEVTMLTRPPSLALGTMVHLKEGRVVGRSPRGCPVGTTVTVRNLFSGLPARRKFLRSTTTEAQHIARLVAAYALASPEVKFTFSSEGRLAFQSPGNGELRAVLAAIHGLETTRAMLEVAIGSASLQVRGLVSPPHLHRANRQGMNFFVNRRWVQSPMLLRAMEAAYQDLLPHGRYPLGALSLVLPPEDLDVNIHPAKREVRFYREGEVYTWVQKAIREALGQAAPAARLSGTLTPAGHPPGVSDEQQQPLFQEERLPPSQPAPLSLHLPILRVVGQVNNVYIIAEGPDGMYLVDQHTAHERVLYERLKARQGQVERQGLLDPLTIEVTPQQREILAALAGELARWGFEAEPFGGNSCLLRSVPAILGTASPREGFLEALEVLEEARDGEERQEGMLRSLACHGAVRAGQALSSQEMRELLRDLEETSSPYTCPHGRPTMIYLSTAQLEREFGRR